MMEVSMTIERQWMGDIALAVLLAMPTLALSRPQAVLPHDHPAAATPMVQQAALAERSPVERRFSLPG
jgi:hypothetical protein